MSGIGVGLLAAAVPTRADATRAKYCSSAMQYLPYAEPETTAAPGTSSSAYTAVPGGGAAGFSYTGALGCRPFDWERSDFEAISGRHPTTVVPRLRHGRFRAERVARDNLVAYFDNLTRTQSAPRRKPAGGRRTEYRSAGREPSDRPIGDKTPRAASSHRPRQPTPPFATPRPQRPKLIARPPMRRSHYLAGFPYRLFAANLEGLARCCRCQRRILVTETVAARISVLHPTPDGARAAAADVYVRGLKQPFVLRSIRSGSSAGAVRRRNQSSDTLRLSRRRCEAGRRGGVVIPAVAQRRRPLHAGRSIGHSCARRPRQLSCRLARMAMMSRVKWPPPLGNCVSPPSASPPGFTSPTR